MQNSNSPQFDLTGKLIIKVALGDDIRRIPIHNEDITYDELVLMMQRVYRGKLSTNDEITIKYKDEDGDLITIFDSSDLTFAIQCSRILKITLFVGGPSKSLLEPSSVTSIRTELQAVRDQVIALLDRLEPVSIVKGTQALSIAGGDAVKADESSHKLGVSASLPVNSVGGKEFDPLTTQKSAEENAQNKIASSFGVDGGVTTGTAYDRAATPDSVSSLGSSSSNQHRAHQQQQVPPAVQSSQHLQQQQPHHPSPSQHQQQQQPMPPQGQHQGQPQGGQPTGFPPQQAGQYPPQMQQAYAGQPGGYGVPPQQQQQQMAQVPQPGQQQPQQVPQQQQPGMYGQYTPGYPVSSGPPGQPGMPQQAGYSQPGGPNPYGQPQMPHMGAAGGAPSPSNPYSRGGFGAGYPRPTAGYPQWINGIAYHRAQLGFPQ